MRILVVEDEGTLAKALRRGLEAEGFAVDVAHDGEDALWRASSNHFDAIVLDIMIPKVNGFRVCSRLRERGDWTPILMLTAKDGELDEAEALDNGADDFLTKPFSYVVLVARIRALLRRGQSERPSVLEVGDLVVDPGQHRVCRGGEEVTLTAKEFSILEILSRNAGRVVTKTMILDHAWDFAFDGEPNIVEVHISSLRRKIDRPFACHSIETIRGVGYRLMPQRMADV